MKTGLNHEDIRNAEIGFAGGVAIAVTGSFKDAPYEGFDKNKFFRSPIVGAITGIAIGRMINKKVDAFVMFLLSIAGERLVIEAYKVGRNRMPAKFRVGEWGHEKCCLCKGAKA